MLITCKECKRLFKGSGDVCSKCENSSNAHNKPLKTCKACGIVTVNHVEEFCFTCAIDTVDHFKIAKEYLYLNPGVTAKALAEATGISILEINSYIRAGRLDISNEPSQVNEEKVCLDCGQVIDHGNLCLFCKKNREALNEMKYLNKDQEENNKNKFFIKKKH